MYDIIIIGAGPAGLSAAIYGCRANKSVLIIEENSIGGQLASAPLIENYPGFKSITGAALADLMFDQATSFGADFEIDSVKEVIPGSTITVKTESGEFKSSALIIATGAKYRSLGLKSEVDFLGKGVHYCAVCDGAFYKDKVVAIVGGANSAIASALLLSNTCKKVYLIHHNDNLKAEAVEIDKLKSKDNVEFLLNTSIKEFIGSEELESVTLLKEGKEENLKLDGVFLAIGSDPETSIAKSILKHDEKGYFIADNGKSNIEGIFIAGDCRKKKNRQVTIAVADGTIAALEAIEYLNKNSH